MLTITLISLSHLHIISLKVFPKHFMHKFTFVSLKNVSKPEWILLLCGHYDLLAKRHYRQNISMWKELKEMKVFALSIGHTINLMMLCKLAFWSLRHWFAKTTIMIFEQELRKTQREEKQHFFSFSKWVQFETNIFRIEIICCLNWWHINEAIEWNEIETLKLMVSCRWIVLFHRTMDLNWGDEFRCLELTAVNMLVSLMVERCYANCFRSVIHLSEQFFFFLLENNSCLWLYLSFLSSKCFESC